MAVLLPTCLVVPVVEKNTFLSVSTCTSAGLPRRSSSVPPSLCPCTESFSFDADCKEKRRADSEDVTDICTEFSDDSPNWLSSESVNTEDEDESIQKDDKAIWLCKACDTDIPPPPPPPPEEPLILAQTRLSSKAACWQPSMTVPESQPKWRVGRPKNAKWLNWWEDSAADIVHEACAAIAKLECISRVECSRNEEGWEITAHRSADAACQVERIQTVAKEALLKAGEDSECIYVLGSRWMPFQPCGTGFVASLGSMRSSEKACWDFYNNAACPRGCRCPWEHPSITNKVHVTIGLGV